MDWGIELVMIVVRARRKHTSMLLKLRKQDQDWNWRLKNLVPAQNCKQGYLKKDINREVGRMVRVSTCAVKNNVFKVKNKHLIFKTSIAGSENPFTGR